MVVGGGGGTTGVVGITTTTGTDTDPAEGPGRADRAPAIIRPGRPGGRARQVFSRDEREGEFA